MVNSQREPIEQAFDDALGEIANAVRRIRKQRKQAVIPVVYELRAIRDQLAKLADRDIQ